MTYVPYEERARALKEWLSSLKIGDEVCITGGRWVGRPELKKVVRRTATQIIIDRSYGERFNATSASQIGDHYTRIEPITDAIRQKIAEVDASHKFSALHTQTLKHGEIRAMLDALAAYRKAEESALHE